MAKHLLSSLLFVFLLYGCASTARQHSLTNTDNNNSYSLSNRHLEQVDTSLFTSGNLTEDKTPVSMMELPRTVDGAFVLAPGFYEADFRTYCLQPGTPGPSSKDAYYQSALQGPRKEIIEDILLNSRTQSQLNQKNIQLLLWSIVSRSQFQKLSPDVQATAWQLLTPKQIFELNGGVLGAAKTVAKILPSSGFQSSLQQLFDIGTSSYEAYERLAVLTTPSQISKPYMQRDQWYKQPEGYYVRYLPDNYQQAKIQVYVPEGVADTVVQKAEDYIVFDPTSMMISPANSNAQRLGVGAPVKDIVVKVIGVIKTRKERQNPKVPKNAPPKETNNSKTPQVTIVNIGAGQDMKHTFYC